MNEIQLYNLHNFNDFLSAIFHLRALVKYSGNHEVCGYMLDQHFLFCHNIPHKVLLSLYMFRLAMVYRILSKGHGYLAIT